MTACKDCKNFKGVCGDAWYNHKCLAIHEPQSFDYILGKNKIGDYAYCRDVNNGNCEHFEPREE